MAVTDTALGIDHISFRHSIDTKIDRHAAIPVNTDLAVGIAKLLEKPKRRDRVILVGKAVNRHTLSREAREARARGAEESQKIKADADREKTVLLAEAKKRAEILRGEGDAVRSRVFADAFNKDPEFFAFYRSLQAYRNALQSGDTTMVLSPNSDFFRYFGDTFGGLRGSARGGGN